MKLNKKIFTIFIGCLFIVSGLFFSTETAKAKSALWFLAAPFNWTDPSFWAATDWFSCDVNVLWGCDDTSGTTTLPSPICSYAGPDNWVTTDTAGTQTVYAYGVNAANAVYFATWSIENGQDDINWYPGTKIDDSTARADINLASHPGLGEIAVHVYLGNASYTNIWCDTANGARIASCTPNNCAADTCIGRWCDNGCDGWCGHDNCNWSQGTKYPNGCAADICIGQWCNNGCDWVQGTKYPDGCAADTCAGQWCHNGCDWVQGTKYPNGCQASRCPGDWCDTGCGWADGTKVCISAPAPTLIFSGTYNGTTAQTLNNVPANSNVTLNWSTNASTTFCDAWGGDATWDAYSPSSAGDSSTRTVPGTLTYTMECWNAASISTGPETVRVNVACVDSFVPWTTVNCDKSCGGGTKTRTGSCTGIVQTQICNSQPCPPGYREVAPW